MLRKTKLGEKDLIITMLDESGMLLRGVAKGARRPGGSFAARLELFAEVDVLMAEGRTLDVVCDARFAQAGYHPLSTLEQSLIASPLAELLCNVAQPDLMQPRVFEMSKAAFDRIADARNSPQAMLAISVAALWKVLAQSGFRPSFTACALCARHMILSDDRLALAIADGGVVCHECPRPADAVMADGNAIRWCEALIRMTYDDIVASSIDTAAALSALEIARAWARFYTGRDLRSLDFLFSSGLFD